MPCRGRVEERVRGKGHTLARSCDVVGGRVGIVWCVICGAYGEESVKGLAKECPGSASRAGAYNIKRFLGGLHPRQWRRLHAPRPAEEESEGDVDEGAEPTASEEGAGAGQVSEGVVRGDREGLGTVASGEGASAEGQQERVTMATGGQAGGEEHRPNVWSMGG